MEGQCLAVTWVDAVHRFEVSEGDDLSCVEAFTLGLCLAWDEDHVALAQEQVGGGWRGVTSIPMAMVTKVQVLATLDLEDEGAWEAEDGAAP